MLEVLLELAARTGMARWRDEREAERERGRASSRDGRGERKELDTYANTEREEILGCKHRHRRPPPPHMPLIHFHMPYT